MIVIFDLSQMDFLLLSVILLYIVLSHCCYTVVVLMIDHAISILLKRFRSFKQNVLFFNEGLIWRVLS